MRIKYLLIGLIVGVLLATAGTAAAQAVIEKITASVRTDYTVELDGKKVELKNPPLAYNGAAYLPIRIVGELVGKEVDFDNGIIKLDTPNETPKEETPLPEDDFISFNDLAEKHGVTIIVGYQVTIGHITFDMPPSSPDRVVTIETDNGSFDLMFSNHRTFVRESEMRKLGIIQ